MTSLRTAAFRALRGPYDYRYWVMSPAYGKPGFQIRAHDRGKSGSASVRVADGVTEEEALKRLADLEKNAEGYARIDEDKASDITQLGADFHDSEPYDDRFQAMAAQAGRRNLRRAPPKFRLK